MNNPKLKEITLWLLSLQRPGGGKNETAVSRWASGYLEDLGQSPYRDKHGNVWVTVGTPSVIFTSHMDTVHHEDGTQELLEEDGIVRLAPRPDPEVFSFAKKRKKADPRDRFWVVREDQRCLGADDGAGVALMMHMIEHGVEGLYLFTVQEELGSGGMRAWMAEQPELREGITHAVAFDRRGTRDIVTHQHGKRMGSSELAEEIARQLDMGHREAQGSHTDNALLEDLVPEIVNISVGYDHEHTSSETLDLNYLDRLADAVLKVAWNDLPVFEHVSQLAELYGIPPELEDVPCEVLEDLCIDTTAYDLVGQDIANALIKAYRIGSGQQFAKALPTLSSNWW